MATASKATKFVYTFGNKKADGNGTMKALLGGKGANLAEMTRIGLPVPPGFTISTEVCTHYYANKRTYPKELQRQVDAGVTRYGTSPHRSEVDERVGSRRQSAGERAE